MGPPSYPVFFDTRKLQKINGINPNTNTICQPKNGLLHRYYINGSNLALLGFNSFVVNLMDRSKEAVTVRPRLQQQMEKLTYLCLECCAETVQINHGLSCTFIVFK